MAGPLVWLKCRDLECGRSLGRAHLEGESTIEIKCRCGQVTSFIAEPKLTRLTPDGQGGFLTIPVVH